MTSDKTPYDLVARNVRAGKFGDCLGSYATVCKIKFNGGNESAA